MKIIISCVIISITLISCSHNNLILYSAYSNHGDFEILYANNIKDIALESWSEEYCDNECFIYVKPKEENQILDVRVMYIGKNGLTLYDRVVSEKPVLIKGKIHDL